LDFSTYTDYTSKYPILKKINLVVVGLRQGLKQGEKIGIEKGKKLGVEEGIEKNKIETAKKMQQSGMDAKLIKQITGIDL